MNNHSSGKNSKNQARLYVAAKYLKNGIHTHGEAEKLKDSEKSGAVVKLNWPR